MGLPPFQFLLDAHGEDVLRFLVASVGWHEAQDCYQETFMAALRAYPRLREGSNLRAWVLTIANHKAVDAHRARGRRPDLTADVEDSAAPEAPTSEPHVWAQVRGLPPKQQAAVVHRFVNDLPYATIGEIMGCSEQAARRSVHEGLKKLREAS